jgi:prepilin-type N-terminal cleavage/methylation domain-containing protein
MKKFNKKGFTLIELLVVIAIIGLLSTMAVISLNSARAKARDAKRLSDVKQLSTTLSLEAGADDNAALAGCVTENALTTACTGPGQVGIEFPKFMDPTTPGTACTAASTDTCGYSITAAAATVSSALIRFRLEGASGSLAAGLHTINSEGIIQ